ncbi:FkbM family methyltransferase [Paenibacillus hamazuiensis]|uniref:FkbM family methyltransferase n=1 Tax=Paenibacillus hamazuiensis TaxID=2936508 RepID=UPI00200FD008|nr:FkbM family methyltransferase [Paenibacillus hamazuiensis]
MDHDFQSKISMYSQFVKPGALCFDVGANVGNRTAVFLHLGANVVAVEPQPDCIQSLWAQFGNHPKFTLVQKALGPYEGVGELNLSQWNPLASMSAEWIHQTKASGRFAHIDWYNKIQIQVTTMDNLIREYGIPAFCKIDVEGYESHVLAGLSVPIPVLSFEFTKEHLQPAVECVHLLAALGNYRFNISSEESMRFDLPYWLEPKQFLADLDRILPNPLAWGDVYAVLVG